MSDSIVRTPGGFPDAVGGNQAPTYAPPSDATASSWLAQLRPASWRGIPFAVRASEYRRGRRFALHEYPFRDQPWAEDVGRATRAVGFSGFVVGDDCYQQARALLAASETAGPGTLVHPSLGTLTVALLEPLAASERAELGRVVEIRFQFVETGTPLYPDNTNDTQSQVTNQAASTDTASAGSFNSSTSNNGTNTVTLGQTSPPTGNQGAPVTYTDSKGSVTLVPAVQGVTPYQADNGMQTVRLWGDQAQQQVSDPGLIAGAASTQAPPAGTTFDRYSLPSLTFDTSGQTVEQGTQALQATQVSNSEAVSANVTAATNYSRGY